MTATFIAPAASQIPVREHSGNLVWTVRAGSTGTGPVLFQVYAPSMDGARSSVRETGVVGTAFTVHAGQTVIPLAANAVATMTQSPDWEWDELNGPDITLDTEAGYVDAIYVADDGQGMILVLLLDSGDLAEFPAASMVARCECGNPFRMCHRDA